MRELTDAPRLRAFMRALGAAADAETTAYLTGGATAVLLGWRQTTVYVDLKLVPEHDAVLRHSAAEGRAPHQRGVAALSDFIPAPSGWEERSPFAAREGLITFRHFDPYAQALAKLERGHERDLADVKAMLAAGLVDAERALQLFPEIEPELYRFPAVDPRAFRRRVERVLGATQTE